jgi:hypothetical protein
VNILNAKGELRMRALWRIIRGIFTLVLSLCMLVNLTGCSGLGGDVPDSPTEPTASNSPANVRVLALNVAYYDGEYTQKHLADDPTLLPNLNYSNQSMEEDYSFSKRADRLLSLLKHYNPGVFFLNEFNFAWWKEVITDEDSVLKSLPKYTHVDSRSTGSSKNGEGKKYKDLYNMVFYDQEQFELLETGTFVTCQTWSGWYDHCTWAKLVHKESGQAAVYAAIHVQTVPNTDERVPRAIKSVQAATEAVETLYELAGGLPIILGGDFNTTEDSRGYRTYDYMVGAAGFKDSRYAAPQSDSSGTARIWGSALKNNGNRIDYIFVNGASVKKYQVASGSFLKDNTYVEKVSQADLTPGKDCLYYDVSDHLPVVSDIILKGNRSTAPTTYKNPVGENDVAATPTGSYTENGGTAEKIIFNFADALDYVGGINQQGLTASLVEHEEYGAVLKLVADNHITAGYISIDYQKLMDAAGLAGIDISDYGKVKITYLADTSYTADGGILKLSVLRDDVVYPTSKNSLGLTTYGTWHTQTLFFSSISGEVNGPVNALSLYNANGALNGDVIYIASIEFVK